MGRLTTTTAGKVAVEEKFVEEPVELFFRFGGRFLWGFWKKWGVERGFLMVNLWWDCGESWSENAQFCAAKNVPLFRNLFLGLFGVVTRPGFGVDAGQSPGEMSHPRCTPAAAIDPRF